MNEITLDALEARDPIENARDLIALIEAAERVVDPNRGTATQAEALYELERVLRTHLKGNKGA